MRLSLPHVVVDVPSWVTEFERRAIKESAICIGLSDILFVQQPMAAAIEVGLAVDEPAASMIVGIGGAMTEMGIIS
jgi:rod shape-determining protein MreB